MVVVSLGAHPLIDNSVVHEDGVWTPSCCLLQVHMASMWSTPPAFGGHSFLAGVADHRNQCAEISVLQMLPRCLALGISMGLIIPIPILFPSEIPWLAKGVHVLSHVAADYIFQTLLYPVHTTAGLTAKAPSCEPCKVNVLLSHPRKLPPIAKCSSNVALQTTEG
jgi:hypothetical protein